MKEWFKISTQTDVINRSLKVGFLVGTLLVIINQGNRLLAGEWSIEILLKIILTYVVPYCVATYAGVSAILDSKRRSSR